MKLAIFVAVVALNVWVASTDGANILFFWAVSGVSHRISAWPSHFFHHFTPKNLIRKSMRDSGLGVDFTAERIRGGTPAISKLWSTYFDFAIKSCEVIVKKQAIKDWIESSNYDLVIINGMFNDCAYGLVHKFNAPYIIYGTTHPFGWWPEAFGYPDENYPEFKYHYPENMHFFQSVHNALQPLYWQWNRLNYMFPKVETVLREGLDIPEMPNLAEMELGVGLVFVNSHFSEEYARSLPPLFVPIGGMHCIDDVKPLAEDLQEFINMSNGGFIYFSLGTFANPASLPKSVTDSIFNAMGNTTSIQFLVKWIDDSLAGTILPKNIKLVKWVSQQDVLGHSKIRAFISHGGLLGTQESVHHGVPTIVIPLFAEQDYNAERVHLRGRGIMLDINELTQDNLMTAIQEILQNNSYVENTQKASKLFKDRPMKPVDTAVWWVEYVLRHKDTRHLQPVGLKRNWLQRRMLDIWLFIAGCGFMCLVILWIMAKTIYKLTFGHTKTKKSKKE